MVALRRAPEAPPSIIGERYGRLTVMRQLPPGGKGVRVLCRCDCGGDRDVYAYSLRAGQARSCGCSRAARPVPVCEPGTKYNRLTIIEVLPAPGRQLGAFARCRCDCGKEKTVRYRFVVTGHTKSCGCAQRDAAAVARLGTGTKKDDLHAAARHVATGLLTHPAQCAGCEKVANHVHRETRLCPPCLESADLLTCECGRRKSLERITAECCDRCAALDGTDGTGMAANLLSALRVLGGSANLDALTEEMRIGYHTLWLCARELVEAGRLFTSPSIDRDDGGQIKLRYVHAAGDDLKNSHGKLTRRGYYVAASKAKASARKHPGQGLVYTLTMPKGPA